MYSTDSQGRITIPAGIGKLAGIKRGKEIIYLAEVKENLYKIVRQECVAENDDKIVAGPCKIDGKGRVIIPKKIVDQVTRENIMVYAQKGAIYIEFLK